MSLPGWSGHLGSEVIFFKVLQIWNNREVWERGDREGGGGIKEA